MTLKEPETWERLLSREGNKAATWEKLIGLLSTYIIPKYPKCSTVSFNSSKEIWTLFFPFLHKFREVVCVICLKEWKPHLVREIYNMHRLAGQNTVISVSSVPSTWRWENDCPSLLSTINKAMNTTYFPVHTLVGQIHNTLYTRHESKDAFIHLKLHMLSQSINT